MTAISAQLVDEVCTQLNENVIKVLDTMFSLKAVPVENAAGHSPTDDLVVGSVGFVGEVNGVVYAHVTAAFAKELTSRMLGMPKAKIDSDEMVNDVVGEMGNMLVGSVKSRLCDNGSTCVLTIPSIVRGRNFTVQVAGDAERRTLAFTCGADALSVEVVMRPAR